MMISNIMQCELISEFSLITPDYEVVTVKSGSYIISTCYRPPSGDISNFLVFLDRFLEFITFHRYQLILGGDFNINMLLDSSIKTEFETTLNFHCCQNTIALPTRITENTETLLDLFITNVDIECVLAGVITYAISDHLPIFLSLEQTIKATENSHKYTYRRINPVTLSSFRQLVTDTNWDDVFIDENPESAYNTFMNKFTAAYDVSFPHKTHTLSNKARKPWVSKEILKLIRQRDRLYGRFIKTRCPNLLKLFKEFRNYVTKELRAAKKCYYLNLFSSSTRRSDDVWRVLNSLVQRSPEPISRIIKDDREITGVDLANAFNNHFLFVAPTSTSQRRNLSFMKSCNQNCMLLDPTDPREIITVFMELKNSKAEDAYGFQIIPVKYVIDVISGCLAHIFNACILTGIFPASMQLARVTVTYKKGNRNEFSNYRPISILPVFSKGLEKVILKRLTSFADRFQILTSAQYGFRKHMSTELALLAQKEYILENFENKNMILGVFFGFHKSL